MLGFRPDGKKVKDIDPIQRIIPHIMRHRHDSQNLTGLDLPCEPMDNFIKDEMALGNGTYNYMHIIIAMLVGLIKFLDRHGLLPMAVINVSPFHTSAFVTNMKSIKGPSIFHHLYDFGNTGLFFAMGK